MSPIQQEIERLQKKYGGLLKAPDLVKEAKSPSSPVHDCFEWDNSAAAYNWRLEQARHLIRVYVTVIDADGPKECRAFVSLSADRATGGGYRTMVSVLNDDALRANLVADAMDEMERFRNKYASLKELAAVFDAMDRVMSKSKATVAAVVAKKNINGKQTAMARAAR